MVDSSACGAHIIKLKIANNHEVQKFTFYGAVLDKISMQKM